MAGLLYLLSGMYLQGDFDRLVYGTRVAAVAVFGGAVYFSALMAIDRKTRRLGSELLHCIS